MSAGGGVGGDVITHQAPGMTIPRVRIIPVAHDQWRNALVELEVGAVGGRGIQLGAPAREGAHPFNPTWNCAWVLPHMSQASCACREHRDLAAAHVSVGLWWQPRYIRENLQRLQHLRNICRLQDMTVPTKHTGAAPVSGNSHSGSGAITSAPCGLQVAGSHSLFSNHRGGSQVDQRRPHPWATHSASTARTYAAKAAFSRCSP